MAQTILIKRSTSTATPTALSNGELAYSSSSNKLFVGRPGGSTGDIDAIGGKYYTDIVDGAASANTVNKLVLRDASGNFSAGTITATLTGTVSDISNHSTDTLSEGSTNLYYTNARADARADLRIAAATTTDLTEGTNLYYTNARADARITAALIDEDNMVSDDATRLPSQQSVKAYVDAQTTDETAEGSTNLYFTNARADARIAAASTTDLTEGTNLYYTDARVSTRADTILSHNNHGNITVTKVGNELRFSAAAQYGDTDVQAYLSGGTGVTLSASGEFSIGQDVATTSNVTFNNVTVNGVLNSDDLTAATMTASGDVVVQGNLTVNGTTTTVNSNTVAIGDSIMLLNNDETGTPSENGGFEIERGTATNVSLLWNEATDYWQVNDGTTTSKILTAGNFAASFTGILDGGTF